MAELGRKGLHLGQNFRQDGVEGLAGPGQQFFLGKAEVPARLAALDDHKVCGAAKGLGPAAQDELRRSSAGNDGRNGNVRCVHKAGQFQREPRAGDHRVHPRFHSGADGGGVVLRGYHGVDGHHARAMGNFLRFSDLCCQCAVVGGCRVAGKVRLPVARVGGGDAAHAAARGHGTGQPAEGDPHAHAAL